METLFDVISTNVELLHHVRPELGLSQIKFGITNDETKDAFAFQHDEQKTISIDIGLLRLFWERAAIAVNLPSVFSEYMPTDNQEIPAWLDADCGTVPAMNSWQVSEDRKDYCIEIFQHMLEYLVLHEFAHHMRGHLELIQSNQSYAAFGEVSVRRPTVALPALKSDFNVQDLELDADAHALDLTITALKSKFPEGEHVWSYDAISETLFLLMFSQILVAQAFDDMNAVTVEQSLHKHPAPIYRSVNFTNLALHTFYDLVGGDWDAYKMLHDAAWSEAGHVAEFLGFPSGRWFGGESWVIVTEDYRKVEQRYFKATEKVDAFIDTGGDVSTSLT